MMRRDFAATLRAAGLAALCAVSSLSFAVPARAGASWVPGEVIVKYRAGATRARRALVRNVLPSVERVDGLELIGAECVRFTGMAVEEACATLAADPAVEYAQPNHVFTVDVVPNDPSFASLWAMKNTGQGGAFAGDDLDATLAWDLCTGDPEMKIGVVDSGIDYTHPDLAANIWTNPGEIPGNQIDDDGNGYVDDVHGYDFVNGDGDPMDDYKHGTHVAGTIGAVGHNGIGVTGVCWRCRLVAIKFVNATGSGTESAAVQALQYALTVGVRLTNNSWGGMSGGQALLDAIDACGAAGQLFVNSAGNTRWNIDAVLTYPQCYPSPYIVTVASSDGRDLMSTFSCWGPTQVDLGAPGSLIYSCIPGGLYQNLDGTSMAAPHVTGVAALAWTLFPHASPQAILALILSAVDTIPSMTGKVWSNGRLNAYRTLVRGDRTAPGAVGDMLAEAVGEGVLRLRWTAPGDDGASGTAASYDLRVANAPMDSAAFLIATPLATLAPHAGGAPETLSVGGLTTGRTYWFALRATDDFGNVGALSPSFAFTPSLPGAGVEGAAARFALGLAGANPSPRGASIVLSLARDGEADVAVYDVRGARVRTLASGPLAAGTHALRWDGADGAGARVEAGVYFVRAVSGRESVTRRLVVLGG
ncbi:MAG: S8 family serine peptidase [Candidatus Eisenbacteria bacterium]|uniref:S8 family serine peptidase n=1 Tax=Eiseniibacteriota bacterium TaxID=2212470 RepID=A0A933SDD2_UNCEI|nr:S8 family serine peptidase [Candidatus Eisenbacteria bacterium]